MHICMCLSTAADKILPSLIFTIYFIKVLINSPRETKVFSKPSCHSKPPRKGALLIWFSRAGNVLQERWQKVDVLSTVIIKLLSSEVLM